MPWQLIYTSAPRGLLSGQSGFCTVARSADLREALVQRLEQISSYHYLRVSEAATANRNPTISAFRLLDLRGAKYYVLTRIQPCGLDFTARTNHLAHHLVFQPDELESLPSPAAILRYWPDWRSSWQDEARLLEEVDPASFKAATKTFLPARTWARVTGDGGRAAGLLESECVRGCYLVCPPGSEEQVLEMYCETLELLNFNGQFPLRPWRHTFTAFLQAEDNPNDFQWRGCQENTPAHKQALTRSAPMIALRSLRIPGNSLVKLAREEPKPPAPPKPGPASPPTAAPAGKTTLKLQRESSNRAISTPAPLYENIPLKQPVRERPPFLNLNFTINTGTLTRLGIFVLVLVILFLVKRKYLAAPPPEEQGTIAQAPVLKQRPAVTAPPKTNSTPSVVPDAKQLDRLACDGPTYILVVPNLTNFTLPINSSIPITRFERLLSSYDRQDPGALPGDIRVEATTDHWDYSPGADMQVRGRTNAPIFSAATPGLDCAFDYSQWKTDHSRPLAVHAVFDRPLEALAIHFGFASPANGDPFRLLIVSENNPPPPLRMARNFVLDNHQDVRDSLNGELWDRLNGSFHLLEGRQWQLQPFVKPNAQPARYLYKDWPAKEVPITGWELDFHDAGQALVVDRQDLKKKLDALSVVFWRPLGKWLGLTKPGLESFTNYCHNEAFTRSGYLDYLKELRRSSPTNSWIRKWPGKFDSDDPGDVSDRFRKLYDLWSENQPQDQPMLTVTNAGGPTNYFYAAWQVLNETESVQDQMGQVQKRIAELGQVAYVCLSSIDPKQPGRGLEMIHFEGP